MAASIKGILECSTTQLCLNTVLVCGQSFRWKQNGVGEWIGVIAGYVWKLKQTHDKIQYQVYTSECSSQSVYDAVEKKSLPKDSSNNNISKDIAMDSKDVIVKGEHTQRRMAKRSLKASPRAYRQAREVNPEIKMEKKDKTSIANGCETKPALADHLDPKNKFSKILYDYFQLGIDLEILYQDWSSKDAHFAKVASHFKGIRMLRQDPVENLLSFVCSSNNHISRISSMVEKLCTHYGNHIATVDGEEYYDFPSLSALCGVDVEPHLRELGFGYRAKFIASIAKHVTHEKGGDEWVRSLRGRSYLEAKSELMSLLGVGAKVADCVCLMSLDQPGAIPVDTHVWQITIKHYMAKLNTAKSLTDKIYNEIGQFYRQLWGPYAGWAHSVLFAADLRQNKERAALLEGDSKPAEKKQGKAKKRPSVGKVEEITEKNVALSKSRKRKNK